jgi:hypothetical protein
LTLAAFEGNPLVAQWMGMTPTRARSVGLLLATFALGCGDSAGNPYSLPVGSDDGGGSFFGGDASVSAGLDAHIEENHVTVTFVTVSCTGPCADVVAVPTGGHAPYTFKWDDGSTTAARQVCPTSSTSYDVNVTDTGTSGELARAAETVQVPLTANVIACPDGGAAEAGATNCETILTFLPSGPVTSDGGVESCSSSAAGETAGISSSVALQAGQEYEIVENATGSALLFGSPPPVWNYYASPSDCNPGPAGQSLGSMTFDPGTPIQSLCFRASADYSHVNLFSSSLAVGLANGIWQLCRGCDHRDASP